LLLELFLSKQVGFSMLLLELLRELPDELLNSPSLREHFKKVPGESPRAQIEVCFQVLSCCFDEGGLTSFAEYDLKEVTKPGFPLFEERAFEFSLSFLDEQHERALSDWLDESGLDSDPLLREPELLFKALSAAAEKGHARPKYLLGLLYSDGYGVTQDTGRAVRLIREAAESEDADAQCLYGFMLHTGSFVPQEKHEASAWLKKAAAHGNKSARLALKELRKGGAD